MHEYFYFSVYIHKHVWIHFFPIACLPAIRRSAGASVLARCLWWLRTVSVMDIFRDAAPSRGKGAKGFSGQGLLGTWFPFPETQTHENLLHFPFNLIRCWLTFIFHFVKDSWATFIAILVKLNSVTLNSIRNCLYLSSLIFKMNKVVVDMEHFH